MSGNSVTLYKHAASANAAVSAVGSESIADEISIVEVVWRRKWIVVASMLLCLVAGIAYLRIATPMFTSSATIFVPTERSRTTLPGIEPQPFSDAHAEAHVTLLRSDTVLSQALADPSVATAVAVREATEPRRWLRGALKIDGRDDGIVTVSLSLADPDEAAAIVNGVVASYFEQQRQARRSGAEAVLQRLHQSTGAEVMPSTEPKVAVAGSGSEVSEAAMAQARLQTRLQSDDPQIVAERLQNLAQRLTEAKLATSQAESLVDLANKLDDPGALQQLLASANLESPEADRSSQSRLTSLLAAIEQERQRLAHLGDRHAAIVALRRQAQAVETRLRAMEGGTVEALRMRLREHLESARQVESQLHETLAAQQQVASTIDQLSVMLVDPARVATEPSSPDPKRVLPISLLAGLLLGGACVLLLDFREQAAVRAALVPGVDLKEPGDVDLGLTETPLLGVVPETTIPAEAAPAWDTTVSSIHHIRAILQVRARQTGQKVFAVTSARRGSGKTSVAVGLASSMALSGTKTLVVDCDLASRIAQAQATTGDSRRTRRHASQQGAASLDEVMHDRGYVPNGYSSKSGMPTLAASLGVASMLDGDPLKACLAPSSVDHLSVLPAGNVTPEHIGMMSDRFVDRLLHEASDYDIVLIDTGPVPGSVEGLLVCSRVDGVLVVAQQGEARQQFEKTLSYLRVVGAKLAGTIFNRAGGASKPRRGGDSFMPETRIRGSQSDGHHGSGLLAAAVLNGSSTRAEAASGLAGQADADAEAYDDLLSADLGDFVDILEDDDERALNLKEAGINGRQQI